MTKIFGRLISTSQGDHYEVNTMSVCPIVLWKLDMYIINEVTWPTFVAMTLPCPGGHYTVNTMSVYPIVLCKLDMHIIN